uniref:rho guanine nucleotide exchange factor 39 n=1 Tax=Myxine glutinosa TaxID=7769 RepID=UPI00358FC44E
MRMVQPTSTIASAILQQRERWQRQFICTSRELIASEQRYCMQLNLLITYFVDILTAKRILCQAVQSDIFGCINEIRSANRNLLVHLEGGRIGFGFEEFCPHLKLYINYSKNLCDALATLKVQTKKNKAFARFKRLQESRPDLQGLTLEDLLSLPDGRLQQYKVFLRNLLRTQVQDTWSSTISLVILMQTCAERAVTETCRQVGLFKASQRNLEHLHRVQSMLKSRRFNIMHQDRVYIREGWLFVAPKKGENLKERMFFLFSDMLLMCRQCHPFHPVHEGKLECQAAFPLLKGSVTKVFGDTSGQGGLIKLTFDREDLLLMSHNQEDISDWFDQLDSSIRQCTPEATGTYQTKDSDKAFEDEESLPRIRKRSWHEDSEPAGPTYLPQSSGVPGENSGPKKKAQKTNPTGRLEPDATPLGSSDSICLIL